MYRTQVQRTCRIARAPPPLVGRVPPRDGSRSRSRTTKRKRCICYERGEGNVILLVTFLCASAANPDLVALLLAILFTLLYNLLHQTKTHKRYGRSWLLWRTVVARSSLSDDCGSTDAPRDRVPIGRSPFDAYWPTRDWPTLSFRLTPRHVTSVLQSATKVTSGAFVSDEFLESFSRAEKFSESIEYSCSVITMMFLRSDCFNQHRSNVDGATFPNFTI